MVALPRCAANRLAAKLARCAPTRPHAPPGCGGVLAALGSARSPACRAPKQPPAGRGLVRSDAKLCGMSARGQSLSMFVVQRSFSRVRRGYDPDEVDRHLELVSRWFTSTDAGLAFTHERAQLQGRERAVASKEADMVRVIEGARLEADATLDGARRRADADKQATERTLTDAQAQAAAIRSDAEAQRAEMLDQARTEAAAAEVIRAAREHASTIVAEANAEAERIHAEARSAGERLLAAAQAHAAEAAERLREQAEQQLQIYEDRRRREADRLAQSARRGRESAP